MCSFKRSGGFTLVELIVAIAILAALSSALIVGYTSYLERANHVATETFLENLKKVVILANGGAGDVETIEVHPMGDRTLFIKVQAICFADDFAEQILAAYPDAMDLAPNHVDNRCIYSFSIPAPFDWGQGAGMVIYTQTNGIWEYYPQ